MRTSHSSVWLMTVLVLPLLLSACDNNGSVQAAQHARTQAAQLLPSNPVLADLYQRSCKSCHGSGAAAAPLTGDPEAWEPLLKKGMEKLLDNAINGYGGMPPLGMCMECDAEQLQALILFMATAGKSQNRELAR